MTGSPQGMMIQKFGDVHIIEFLEANILDQVRIENIRNELDAIVDKSPQPKLLLSFQAVTHISSAVLGVLMSLDKKAKAKRGEIRLAHISPSIRQVFSITKLDKVLKIFPTTEEAMLKFVAK
ncbi:MAG: STAS domain-containing protein [Planctomycetota bacterium]|nr:STAS domain-containing protein [Planctomycetota bacterium]